VSAEKKEMGSRKGEKVRLAISDANEQVRRVQAAVAVAPTRSLRVAVPGLGTSWRTGAKRRARWYARCAVVK
jgi:hypothetical protein